MYREAATGETSFDRLFDNNALLAVGGSGAIVPEQVARASYPAQPECDLIASVLDAAKQDLCRYRFSKRRRGQRLYWQAYRWVMSDDRRWPFSFINICETLRLNPSAIREGLVP